MHATILGIRKLRQEVHEFETNFGIHSEIPGKLKRKTKYKSCIKSDAQWLWRLLLLSSVRQWEASEHIK